MKLKRIKLVNYRQHRDFSVDFTGNLIAVVGRNGSGKSNFLGAIQFALTGEQPGFTKDDLLTWGEEAGYVALSFEHNGRDCLVQRRIEKPAVTLSVDGEKFTGAKKVAEVMDEVLGIDRDVMRQSVFVRQTEIESCLFEDARTREMNFQKLVGLGDAAKHNKFLSDYIASLDKPQDLTADIERHTALVKSAEDTVASLSAKAAELDSRIALFPDGGIAARIADLTAKRQLVMNAVSENLNVARCADALERFSREHPDVTGELPEIQDGPLLDRIHELGSRIDGVKSAKARNIERDDLGRSVEKLNGVLAAMRPMSDIDADIEKSAGLQRRYGELSARMSEITEMAGNAPSGRQCPLCGSTVDHDIKAELMAKVEALKSDRDAVKAEISALGRPELEKADRQKAESSLENLSGQLGRMGPREPDGDANAADLEAEREAARSKLEDMRAEYRRAMGLVNEMRRLEGNARDARALLESAMAALPSKVDPSLLGKVADNMQSAISDLLRKNEELSALKAEKAKLDGGIEQAGDGVRTARELLSALVAKQDEYRRLAGRIAVLQDVKDWFGYKNGPRVMSQAVMAMLTDETNKYLSKLGAEFTVVPMEEGMGFRYVYNDGRTVSSPPPEAAMLSGGQKIALAVAFRFAVYGMFASKLGLLSLDEPTAYLDDETIARFADTLDKVRGLARNLGLMVLVSTHEKSLEPCFDQAVHVGQ